MISKKDALLLSRLRRWGALCIAIGGCGVGFLLASELHPLVHFIVLLLTCVLLIGGGVVYLWGWLKRW